MCKYNGILALSGDGLPFEITNGNYQYFLSILSFI